MDTKKEATKLDERLAKVQEEIEDIIKEYRDEYSTNDYWDNFQDTLANVSAQIYLQRILCRNATIKQKWTF